MSPMWKWPRRRRSSEVSTVAKSTPTFGTPAADKLHFSLSGSNGTRNLVVMCPDGKAFTFPNEHPNYEAAVKLALDEGEKDSEKYRKLFDVEESVRDLFGVITDRVRVAEGEVYFDDKPVHNTVTEQILRFMEEGIPQEKWTALAKFMENIAENPNENSRNQLYDWLELHHLAIDEDGHVVCFKGVSNDYKPSRNGPGTVVYPDGRVIETRSGLLDYHPGNVVSIDRAIVNENKNVHCSVGLHVSNRRYADSFSTRVVEVRVNPRDFVSVTADSGREKIRCCRLRVVGDAPPADYFNSALRVGA
jgi:hypothetical protein